uniref:RING-type E3 ubiquitin transferase n=1 Tax=Arcella intermedia TaxID=1963864 RepID=A0A6B2LG62_9EUKA
MNLGDAIKPRHMEPRSRQNNNSNHNNNKKPKRYHANKINQKNTPSPSPQPHPQTHNYPHVQNNRNRSLHSKQQNNLSKEDKTMDDQLIAQLLQAQWNEENSSSDSWGPLDGSLPLDPYQFGDIHNLVREIEHLDLHNHLPPHQRERNNNPAIGILGNENLSYEVLSQLEDVKVGINPTQLSAYSTTFKYKKDSHPEESCPICMSEYEESQLLRRLNCFHSYHQECIDAWFQSSKKCPICKLDITLN